MATRNETMTSNWKLAVPAGNEFTMTAVSIGVERSFMVAVTASGSPAVTYGHPVDPGQREGVTRADVGPGIVWVRTMGAKDITAVITDWTA